MDSDEERNYEQVDFYLKEEDQTVQLIENNQQISIALIGREIRGSGLKKHTAYLIKGYDKNGEFSVLRRFNQFHQMRVSMVRAWPGCLIPSLPSKNPLLKNEEQLNRKRQRYLNDFLKKMSQRPYLYYSEQFQALLRSQQTNLSDTFQKWPAPSPQSIINRYRYNFSQLAGKQISKETITQIFDFARLLEYYELELIAYRKMVKELAFKRDRYNYFYVQFFKTTKRYEQTLMLDNFPSDSLLYANSEFAALQQHVDIIKNITMRNPYWLLYDLIKNQERDGRAFSELLRSIQYYADKTKDYQNKIQKNVKGISEASLGKKNLSTFVMKGTTDEIKYQLEIENQVLKKEKEYTQILKDIVIALVAFIEIKQYKICKKQFYQNTLLKLTTNEIKFAETTAAVWTQLQDGISKLAQKFV